MELLDNVQDEESKLSVEDILKQGGGDPDFKWKCVESVRSWIENEENLNGRTDDVFILKYLIHCKYDVEHAKRKIHRYYTNRKKHPKWYKNRDPTNEKIQALLSHHVFGEIKQTDADGSIIFIMRACHHNPSLFDIDSLTKLQLLLSDRCFANEKKFWGNGIVVIGDVKDVHPKWISFYTPTYVANLIDCTFKSLPVTVKSVHWVNTPAIFLALYTVGKMFLPERIKKLMHLHGNDYSSLHRYIAPKYLPVDYGGLNGTVDESARYLKNKIEEYRDYLLDDEKYGFVDETVDRNKSSKNTGRMSIPTILEVD